MDARTGGGSSTGDADSTTPLTRRGVLAGAAGTLATATAGVATAQQSASGGDGGVEVDLVDYAFEPGTNELLVIPPGTTVTFVWQTGGHNIHVDSQPDGANWQGNEAIEDAGFSVEHTFDVAGKYHFWCVPHKGLGMVGDIEVKEGASVSTVAPAKPLSFPGGDAGVSFMGLLFGTAGIAAAIVLVGELHGSLTRDTEGPTSAHSTFLLLLGVGLVLLLAVVGRLLLG